jgi:arginine/lysine/ornithine decarboxylase
LISGDEQSSAPYLDAVVSYAFRGTARYHVPGHKGGPGADPGVRKAIGTDALAADVPLLIHGIDVGPQPRPYERAERLAAEAYGAAQTWFLTNGATQGNHVLCMALAPEGAKVVIQRNAHTSVFDGLILSGGMPNFVMPEYDAELGLSHCVTPTSLEVALSGSETMRAVMITSPTYYGMTADVAALASVAHVAGVPLIVDQSWGSHFGFHEALPPSALTQGADAVLTSTHKTVGSLTQSAMLHLAEGSLIDATAVSRAMRLLRSTSPSSLLLLSLDGARRQLALHGEQLLHEALAAVEAARAKLSGVPGISLVDASLIGTHGIAAHDRLRIVIDVRGSGRSGYEIAAELRRTYDSHVELPTHTTIVLIIGLGEHTAALERLAGDVDEVVKRLSRSLPSTTVVVPPPPWARGLALSPREAFLSRLDCVTVADAVGRISAESIASYPPGIPALLSGERVSSESVDYLVALAGSGVRLHGASDPAFRTIHVVSGLSPAAPP